MKLLQPVIPVNEPIIIFSIPNDRCKYCWFAAGNIKPLRTHPTALSPSSVRVLFVTSEEDDILRYI